MGVVAFGSLDSFREYRAEVSIIVLPQGNAFGSEQVVENVAALPKTLDFFDALLASDARLTEFSDIDEAPVAMRKAAWKNMLEVKRQGRSGIVTYTLEAKNQEEAELLARQMTKVLFEKVGVYYDIRSQISLRLVEGPLVRTSVASPVQWIGLSLLLGTGAALAGTALLMKLETVLRRRSKNIPEEEGGSLRSFESAVSPLRPETFVPKKPAVLFSETGEARAREEQWNQALAMQESEAQRVKEKAIEKKAMPLQRETVASAPVVTQRATAGAPANLPVMDEATFLAQFSTVNTEETPEEPEVIEPTPTPVAPSETTEASLSTEPTVEEYRRRLNELLRQGK
jgi:capsular polysaccharide biosynthesis protein